MKLVKATRLAINKDHKGELLAITHEGITVSDEVASELQQELGETIEVSDVVSTDTASVAPETQPEVTSTEVVQDVQVDATQTS